VDRGKARSWSRTRLPLADESFLFSPFMREKHLAIVARLSAQANGCGNGLERGDRQRGRKMSEFCGIGLRAFLGDNEGYEREAEAKEA